MKKLSLITLAIAGVALSTVAQAQIQERAVVAKKVTKNNKKVTKGTKVTKITKGTKVTKVTKVVKVVKWSSVTTVVKPGVTTTIGTTIIPSPETVKPTVTQPTKPVAFSKDVVAGVATVETTAQYKKNHNVYAGDSLSNARGDNELNVKKGDLNKLVVGKTTIDLLPKEKNKNGITVKRTATTTLNVGHYLTYAKHGNYMEGYIQNGTVQGASVVFYQGYETPKEKVPTSGKAVYKGVAVHTVLNAQDPSKTAHSVEAKSQFDVDFGKKRISGEIKPNSNKFNSVKLAGKLEGNRIVGDAVNGFRSMEGRFFGPNAEEISGRYDVTAPGQLHINGTFGAKKQ